MGSGELRSRLTLHWEALLFITGVLLVTHHYLNQLELNLLHCDINLHFLLYIFLFCVCYIFIVFYEIFFFAILNIGYFKTIYKHDLIKTNYMSSKLNSIYTSQPLLTQFTN